MRRMAVDGGRRLDAAKRAAWDELVPARSSRRRQGMVASGTEIPGVAPGPPRRRPSTR